MKVSKCITVIEYSTFEAAWGMSTKSKENVEKAHADYLLARYQLSERFFVDGNKELWVTYNVGFLRIIEKLDTAVNFAQDRKLQYVQVSKNELRFFDEFTNKRQATALSKKYNEFAFSR